MKALFIIAIMACLLNTPIAFAKGQNSPVAQPPVAAQPAPATPMPKNAVTNTNNKPTTTAAKQDPTKNRGKPTSGGDVGVHLEKFGQDLIAKMNKHGLNCESKKTISKNTDGSYSARYKAVDHQSLRTSYSKPENARTIAYIGHLTYDEVSYVCTGATEKAAKTAPCKEVVRESFQELVKHKNGKWTY